jgi:hypothetical protein
LELDPDKKDSEGWGGAGGDAVDENEATAARFEASSLERLSNCLDDGNILLGETQNGNKF